MNLFKNSFYINFTKNFKFIFVIFFISLIRCVNLGQTIVTDDLYLACKNANFNEFSINAFTPFICGTGTEFDPYILAFPEGLQKFSSITQNLFNADNTINYTLNWFTLWDNKTVYIKQLKDLDLNSQDYNLDPDFNNLNSNPNFDPIFNSSNNIFTINTIKTISGSTILSYRLKYDGNGKNIINLARDTNNLVNDTGGGLFSELNDSEISNLNLKNIKIITLNNMVGGLVNKANNVFLNNIALDGTVLGSNIVGGLVGYMEDTKIKNANLNIFVSGDEYVGGVAGNVICSVPTETIINTKSNGKVQSNNNYAGGIAGRVWEKTGTTQQHYCSLYNISSSGVVEGNRFVGGLVGAMSNSGLGNNDETEVSIINSSISGTGDNVGGLVGKFIYGTLKNFNVLGQVTVNGHNTVGGLVGEIQGSGIVLNKSIINLNSNVKGVGSSIGGLFGKMNTSIITLDPPTSINLLNVSGEVSGEGEVGGIVGEGIEIGILNCNTINLNVKGTKNNIGGLVGNIIDSTISNTQVSGNITGIDRVGGLVGNIINTNVSNTKASGNITGKDSVGGLVGNFECNNNQPNSIIDSSTTGVVLGKGVNVGGLVGNTTTKFSSVNCYIFNVSSTSTVTGIDNVGGLVGNLNKAAIGPTPNIELNISSLILAQKASYYKGKAVNGEHNVGGLIGILDNGYVTYAYAETNVNGSYDNIGGVIGSIINPLDGVKKEVDNVYYNGTQAVDGSVGMATINGGKNVGGIVGYLVATVDVDFINIYSIGSIKGNQSLGGFIGKSENGDINISNAYNIITFQSGGSNKGDIIGEFSTGLSLSFLITNVFWNSMPTSRIFGDRMNNPVYTVNFTVNNLKNCDSKLPFFIPVCK